MTIDKQALREAAEKATKGPWKVFSDIDTKTFAIHTPRDKRCENVIKWGGFDCQKNAKANAEFIAAFNPKVALALLDENIQLQREKDAIEAVALALRDDMRQAREQLEAAEKRNAELERSETQLIDERDNAESALNDAYKAVMGQAPEWSNWFSFENAIDEIELACELWRNQTDDQSGFAQCMSAYSTRAGIGVKQQEDSVDSDVGRNQPGMVVAVHIGAGDFVKIKGQVFEVEETDFDDHDVTLWFVGGNALKCAAGCPVEVVSAPVAAGIKVKES
ncbi:ead/Ea22-like family protein [Salmonella enterica]|uniref:Ead/Ea22-like family protein n=1 Tax=Salmonella enterica TaxID=28901 RepID=A0A3R0Y5D5_SALER|nr:ead/Ea22-like family protein [Salmonella enterica]